MSHNHPNIFDLRAYSITPFKGQTSRETVLYVSTNAVLDKNSSSFEPNLIAEIKAAATEEWVTIRGNLPETYITLISVEYTGSEFDQVE